ncbi:MAG: hypothetical protein U9N77_05035 [Thermodesulfobacteriota bacterium]|nr:hypothetical protein [Thermodesulfobacteriota bacterium]
MKLVTGLHGFKQGCGFHRCRLTWYINKSLNNGFHVALIREAKKIDGTVFRRVTALIRAKGSIQILHMKTKKGVQMELPF